MSAERMNVIRASTVRLIALAVVPVLNGCLMVAVGRRFTERGRRRSGFEHFTPAFVFSLIFGAIRFFGAK